MQSADVCLTHGCSLEYDFRSGFSDCPQCETERKIDISEKENFKTKEEN